MISTPEKIEAYLIKDCKTYSKGKDMKW